MAILVSGSRRPISTERRDLKGYAASRKRYDALRRRIIEDPTERAAFRAAERLVRRDPCSFCGVSTLEAQMAADHIVPVNRGGRNDSENLTAACRPCNAAKRDKSLLLFLLSSG